jgi:hypothetical protein
MAFCGKCGASITEGVAFCGKCGTPVQPGAGGGPITPPPPPPQYYPPPGGGGTAPNLVTRVINILTKPKQEWPVIAGESTSIAALYSGYVVILAALPVIASFLQMSILGSLLFRVPMATGLIAAIVGYALALGGIYVSAFVIDKLAPNFQSQSNLIQAFKLVVYASTASWVAGICNIIPFIGWLFALAGAIYGIYLFYLGLPVMMKTPPDKVVIYMIVSAVVLIVVYVVIGIVVGTITAAALVGRSIIG